MIFGDPSDFAIEAMTEPHLVPPSGVWGRMCLRIGDLTLGDYDNPHCGLGAPCSHFEELKNSLSNLWDSEFDSLDDAQIYDQLDQALYGDDDRSMAEFQRDSHRFSRFDFLTNWEEQFDGYKCFILGRKSEELLILCRLPDDRRVSVSVTVNGFVNAINGLLAWFDSESERLRSKVV